MKIAIVSEQGIRPTMEDTHFIYSDFGGKGWVYVGIYDGHGGKEASEYTSEHLPRLFLQKLLGGLSPQEAFIQTYEMVSDEMNEFNSGTTAVDVFIRGGIAYAANVGDGISIVIGRENVHQLTAVHRLDDTAEKQRIEQMGGHIIYPYIYRGNQGIMPTRTLGDNYFKPVGIIATPSVSEYRLSKDDFLVLAACDGLFDFMNKDEVALFAIDYTDPQVLLEKLKHEVLVNRSGTDNLTVVAVSLKYS